MPVFKKKISKFLVIFLILFAVFVFGLYLGLNSWNKNLYVSWNPSKGRGLAGSNTSAELINLSSDQLIQQASYVLFSNHQVIRQENLLAFYLGNFLVHDSDLKEHRFICQIYPLVEFSFSSMDVSLSGEEGMMLVQSPCLMEDEDFIGPFVIPVQSIFSDPEKKSFELPEEETFVHFYNASIVLTEKWFLKTVRFFNQDSSEELIIRFIPGEDKPYFEFSLKDDQVDDVEPVERVDI